MWSNAEGYWSAAHKFFEAAVEIWAQAPIDGELLAAHRVLLIHLRETARDRMELYTISPSDRAMYRAAKVDEKVRASEIIIAELRYNRKLWMRS